MVEPTRLRAARRALGILVVAVVAFLFARTLSANWEQVRATDVSLRPEMAAAVLLFATAVPLSGLLWGRILRELTATRVHDADVIAVHCASWLLKYIPGQVGSVINKVAWGQRRGIPRTVVLLSFLYENVFLQLASLVPAVAILAATTGLRVVGDGAGVVLGPLLLVPPMAVVLRRPWFHGLMSGASRRLLGSPLREEHFLSSKSALGLVALFLVPRVLNGVGFVLISSSVVSTPADAWVPLAAAYVLAGAIGILAVFVPSGLGVRESVIVLFAVEFMSTPDAIVVALVSRLVTVVADVGVLATYGGASMLHRRRAAT